MIRFFLMVFILGAGATSAHAQECLQKIEQGRASWYGARFEGKPTASGEIFTAANYTAAHPTLPFGSHIKIINLKNNRSVIVRVNDRGNFAPERIVDLSEAAAKEIGMRNKGVASVKILSCNP